MGVFTWLLNNMLTQKFYKLVKKDGLLYTYKRPHRANRNNQYHGGHAGPLKAVGQDIHGNTYYEDYSVDYRLNARWVEYADHYKHLKLADTIPAEWDGWLKYLYKEVPSDNLNFVNHFYRQEREPVVHNSLSSCKPPGYNSIFNERDPNEFFEQQIQRKYTVWTKMYDDPNIPNGQQKKQNIDIQIEDETQNY